MRLYHGSNTVIDTIDLSKGRPNKDFGRGFYVTTIKEQAEKMARRVVRIYGGEPYVTVFEFDEKRIAATGISCRRFDRPTKEWALFVINNRNRHFEVVASPECNIDNKYEIVIGPVANDDLALLFRQFAGGFITVEELTEEMKYKELTLQYSFHSERAVGLLNKVEDYHG
ncbi:MAG: DUF3990 domain-containing protein [Lachnospiraceae bacterium]|nr:DUF3990 domain-containing protein [Lachnospiraceae bacterium]